MDLLLQSGVEDYIYNGHWTKSYNGYSLHWLVVFSGYTGDNADPSSGPYNYKGLIHVKYPTKMEREKHVSLEASFDKR